MDKSLLINKIIKELNFNSDAEFARFLGISPQNLSKWKMRGTFDAELIYTKCPQLNPEWLLTGNGSMLKENVPTINKKVKNKDGFVGNSINGNISITHNDLEKILELHKSSQDIQNELNERLKSSQNQIDTLLEILKNK
ncbi:helix-turn-helix domain-containing protein [Ornithobacterium rhinotracheale]|uniref:helix-turn-helix domain-containing protein n=1 Tax=Ornithobacterium rhinotracheale TaxID=28251 RepID=UPI00129D1811|nr:helix-turn-helix domain-containing protein [Ornithobacterium rhinotracheale]MRI64205.1 transcriptional regulator [Ornithobacterium rhinotracheale]MRJ11374.1 transcriptional regulator [Ornithobacterium rhinotracheale]